jgi:hypothetical protein
MHTAVNIAFPVKLEKYNDSGALLGEHQNLVEADNYSAQHHSILRPTHDDAKGNNTHFETNTESGVLPPLLGSHPEGQHIHVGRVAKLGPGEFRGLTKTEGFPKGISHTEFYDAINEHYYAAHGQKHYGTTPQSRIEKVQEHPLVEKFHNFIASTGGHPGDYNPRNLGTWTHPHTGEKHIVASDYGFSTEVAKHYDQARGNMYKQKYKRW